MHQMTETERAEREAQKSLHARCRAAIKQSGDRYALLAWAFVRGLPYRRIERRRRFQTNGGRLADRYGAPVAGRPGFAPFEHNAPSLSALYTRLQNLQAWISPIGGQPAAASPLHQAARNALRDWLAEPCPDLGVLLAADAAKGTLEPSAAAE